MMSILIDVGFIRWLSIKIRPLFKLIMPRFKDEIALDYMSTNIVSNMLGLGYGATPSGLKAIKRMQELNDNDKKES